MASIWRSLAAAGAFSLGMWLSSGTAFAAVPDDPQQLLKYADSIKSSNNGEFESILKKMRESSVTLTPRQQLYLRYLSAWQQGYRGNYETAVRLLQQLIPDADDDIV